MELYPEQRPRWYHSLVREARKGRGEPMMKRLAMMLAVGLAAAACAA
jgi:hypothetical protein